jgi:hypothetical protein
MTEPKNPNSDKDKFLYPRSTFRGEFTPENLVFDANLQEFAQRISFICNLETNGKLTPHDAYSEIKKLYKELKNSRKELGIGEQPPAEEQ